MHTTDKPARVLITAGASGIGRNTAETFLQQGAQVHVCDVSPEHLELLRKTFPEIGSTLADVSQPADVDRLFAEVDTCLGGLDVLINNAGIAGPTAPVEEVSIDDWERTLSVNLTGQFLCSKLAVPRIRKAGGGSMVNLSSVAGRLGYPLRSPYAASKWAVIGFTKTLAAELGPDGIRVNAILPGPVEGPRIQGVIKDKAMARGISYDAMETEYLGFASLHRMVSAEDVTQMITFLCSNAGKNISGQAISVCGNTERLA